MMPTPEQREREAIADRDRRFRPPEPTPTLPEPTEATLAQAEADGRRWWEQDRRARIRRGACPVCAERLCPRVGGPDRECVPAYSAAAPSATTPSSAPSHGGA